MIINENFIKADSFIEKGKGNKIIIKNKSFFDLSYCSGVVFLGHNHKIFKKSIKDIYNKNISVFANPNIHALKLSKTIKSFFSNFKKIVFCNTGSESVIKALRISRSINSKKIVVCVTGSWHGSVDQTLFAPQKNFSPLPISSGLRNIDRKYIKFIPYNDIKNSQKILNKYKKKINCILIEPITSSLPLKNVQPYLKFIESYSKKNKIVLIFDEIITGFRTKKGSVQEQFNIKPDITLIGKILGGGLPIGVIGISNKIYKKMKTLKKKIFFGGTFSANTFSTFVGNNVITYIKNNNNQVEKLIKNCEIFESKINNFIKNNKINAKVYRFDSISRIVFSKRVANNIIQRDFLEKKNSKRKIEFFKFLKKNNICYPRNGVVLLSLANNNRRDLEYIIKKICLGLKKYF